MPARGGREFPYAKLLNAERQTAVLRVLQEAGKAHRATEEVDLFMCCIVSKRLEKIAIVINQRSQVPFE